MLPTSARWPNSKPQEQAAFAIVEQHLGEIIIEWDTGGKSGAVDGRIQYADGHDAAIEVMSYMADDALRLEARVSREPVLPTPGSWLWLLQVPNYAVYEDLLSYYAVLISLCESNGAHRPEELPIAIRAASPEVQKYRISRANLVGWADLAPGETAEVRVVLPGMGGAVDRSLKGLRAELEAAYKLDVFERHFAKLHADPLPEKHLFIPVHYTAFSFPVSDGLQMGSALPPDPPPFEPRVTYLWIASHMGSRVLLWNDGKWSQFWT
jgi:hypothetical protein